MAMGPPGVLAVMAAEGMVYANGGLANVLGVDPAAGHGLPLPDRRLTQCQFI
jgi:hypothetical protein